MNRMPLFVACLLAAVFQPLLPVPVPLLTALAVVGAVHLDRRSALGFAAVAGLLFDLSGAGPVGISVLLLAGSAEAILRIRSRVYTDRMLSYAVLGGLAAWVHETGRMLYFAIMQVRPVGVADWVVRPGGMFIAGAICTPVVALVLLPMVRRSAEGRLR